MTEFKGDTGGAIKKFYALLRRINEAMVVAVKALASCIEHFGAWLRDALDSVDMPEDPSISCTGHSAPRRRPSRKAKHTPKHTPPWEIRSQRHSINYGQAWQRCPQRHWRRESRGQWQQEREVVGQ